MAKKSRRNPDAYTPEEVERMLFDGSWKWNQTAMSGYPAPSPLRALTNPAKTRSRKRYSVKLKLRGGGTRYGAGGLAYTPEGALMSELRSCTPTTRSKVIGAEVVGARGSRWAPAKAKLLALKTRAKSSPHKPVKKKAKAKRNSHTPAELEAMLFDGSWMNRPMFAKANSGKKRTSLHKKKQAARKRKSLRHRDLGDCAFCSRAATTWSYPHGNEVMTCDFHVDASKKIKAKGKSLRGLGRTKRRPVPKARKAKRNKSMQDRMFDGSSLHIPALAARNAGRPRRAAAKTGMLKKTGPQLKALAKKGSTPAKRELARRRRRK